MPSPRENIGLIEQAIREPLPTASPQTTPGDGIRSSSEIEDAGSGAHPAARGMSDRTATLSSRCCRGAVDARGKGDSISRDIVAPLEESACNLQGRARRRIARRPVVVIPAYTLGCTPRLGMTPLRRRGPTPLGRS
jgi:hypothetical protein